MKINAGSLQDLHHYALAMKGNREAAFPGHTLMARLAAAQRVYEMLTTLDADEPTAAAWDNCIKEPAQFTTEAELTEYGQRVIDRAAQCGQAQRVNPYSGEHYPAPADWTNEQAWQYYHEWSTGAEGGRSITSFLKFHGASHLLDTVGLKGKVGKF